MELDDLCDQILTSGPRVVKELGVRLRLGEAEDLCKMLRGEGLDVSPYDLPYTQNIWIRDGERTPYCNQATKELVQYHAAILDADYTTVEGFSKLLPRLVTNSFVKKPINEFGTTLAGLLQTYGGSASTAVLDLVYSGDPEFARIKAARLKPWDFHGPQNLWKDKKGKKTGYCKEAMKEFIKYHAQELDVDYKTVEGFKRLLPLFTEPYFLKVPMNVFGTTLSGLYREYNGSPSAIVLDLVYSEDPEFEEIREANLQASDFAEAPKWTWRNKDGTPTKNCLNSMYSLAQAVARQNEYDIKTEEGRENTLNTMATLDHFNETPINIWGTRLSGIMSAYGNSPRKAVNDLRDNWDSICKAELSTQDNL